MVELHVERVIAAPQPAVFAWLADPGNLTTAPLAFRAGFCRGTCAPAVGAQRWLVGAGIWVREEITTYDPPDSYSYRILRAIPAFDHRGGTLTFTPSGMGTHVDWRSSYTHPLYAGGAVTQAITGPLLRSSFLAILGGCANALEQ